MVILATGTSRKIKGTVQQMYQRNVCLNYSFTHGVKKGIVSKSSTTNANVASE